MKKTGLAVMVVAVAIAFALNAFAVEVKETVQTKGDTTIEKTEIKGSNVKAKETVTTTSEGTVTEQKLKTKNVKMEKERVDTPEGSAGLVKVDVKKGALKELNIEWAYFKQGTEYIIEYDVKDKTDKELLGELGLTPTEANLIQPGMHRIVSTSPYTAGDVQANFQDIIVKDLASTLKK